jgi:CubicO group peptidase (beta-lactamase class C family)
MIKKISLVLLAIVVVVVGLAFTNHLAHLKNFMFWGEHTIHDYKTHPLRKVEKANAPQSWEYDSTYNSSTIPADFLSIIDSNDTHAFLVIQNGKLLFEKYWDGYDSTRLSGSFSAAKSIVSLLVGIALDEGKIKSLDEPVANYVDHFKTNGLEKVTIKNLLTMSSGTNYMESDKSYFSMNAYGYYGDDLEYMVEMMEKKEDPGVFWQYRSGDTQVLGLLVEKAFGQNISTLVSERFYKPMGAEYDAFWLLDGEEKREKAFCCFNASARDYARFGQLVLNKGNWNGKQIVSEKYVTEATSPASFLKDREENNQPVDFYGYQYWILKHSNVTAIAQNGLFGQYVYIIPEKNAVVVRLGESKVTKPIHHFQPENYTYVDAALAILK